MFTSVHASSINPITAQQSLATAAPVTAYPFCIVLLHVSDSAECLLTHPLRPVCATSVPVLLFN